MTVAQLIKKLEKMPKKSKVVMSIQTSQGFYDVRSSWSSGEVHDVKLDWLPPKNVILS